MNTLRDTDERRARPSVWPVYLAAAVISGHSLLISLFCAGLIIVAFGSYDAHMAPDPVDVFVGVLPCFVWAALGFMATWETAKLHGRRWWCAMLWAVCGLSVIVYKLAAEDMSPAVGSLWLELLPFFYFSAVFVLIIWIMVTRRRLFFRLELEVEGLPPRPASEE